MGKPRILFVGCKYCDANPDHGETNAEHYLKGSLVATKTGTYDAFYFDEYFFENKTPGDKALLEKAVEYKPDILFLDWQNGSEYNPKPETLKVINYNLKIPVIAIWWDHIYKLHIQTSEKLQPFIDLNVVVDSGAYRSRVLEPTDYLFLWTPQDPRLYYPEEKTIPAAFIGRTEKANRKEVIAKLKSIKGFIQTGGQREAKLSKEDYAEYYRKTAIMVNFTEAKVEGINQLVGHALEATLAGCLLLEQKSPETAGLFIPGKDFVEWTTTDDLVEKVKYYIKHPKEREAIAKSGYEKAVKYYSGKVWWDKVFKGLKRKLDFTDFDKSINDLAGDFGLRKNFTYKTNMAGPHRQMIFYLLRSTYESVKAGDFKASEGFEFVTDPKTQDASFYLRELIAQYLLARDFPSVMKFVADYINEEYPHHEFYKIFLVKLGLILGKLSKKLAKKKTTDLAFIMFDSMREKDVEQMETLKAVSDAGINFEKAYSAAIYTRPSVQTIFTGEMLFENDNYKERDYRIDIKKSKLLQTLKKHKWDTYNFTHFKFLSIKDGAKFPVKICKEREGTYCNSYKKYEGIKYTTSELFWKYLCEMTKTKKNTFSIFLCEEFHTPTIGGYHTKRPIGIDRIQHYTGDGFNQEDIDRQARECLEWLDLQLNFLLSHGPPRMISIISSDHGQMLGEHGHIGGGLTWYDESYHVPLIINGISKQTVRGVYSLRKLGNDLTNMIETGKLTVSVSNYAIVQRDQQYDKKFQTKKFMAGVGKKFMGAFIAKVGMNDKLVRHRYGEEYLRGDENEDLINSPEYQERIDEMRK